MPIATATFKKNEEFENFPVSTKRNSLTTCTVVEVNKEKLQLNSKIAERRHSMEEEMKNLEEVYNV